MELNEYKPGQAVFLKSGSPALSVVHVETKRLLVWVTWQAKPGEKQKDTVFALGDLTHTETLPQPEPEAPVQEESGDK